MNDEQRNEHLDLLFATTVQTILDGYSFQQAVLRGGSTVQFGTWLTQSCQIISKVGSRGT